MGNVAQRSVMVGRLRVLTPAWTLVMLAPRVPVGELTAMIRQAVFLGVLNVDELLSIAAERSRLPGGSNLRAALRAYIDGDEGSDSRLEDDVKLYLPEIDGDPIRQNLRVQVGDKHYRLDLAYEGLKIAVEPGAGHHDEKVEARNNRVRRRALESIGWTLIDIRAADFDADPIRATQPARELILERASILETARAGGAPICNFREQSGEIADG